MCAHQHPAELAERESLFGAAGRALRVAIVSKTFVADAAQRQLEQLARIPGIALTLLTPGAWRADDGRTLTFQSRYTAGYDVRTLDPRFSGRYHLYTYRGLAGALGALRPDLIHIDEEPYNPAAAQAQRVASRLGVPTVYVAWQNIQRSYPPPFSAIERYCYRAAAHIIAGNADAGAVLRAKGYHGPLSVFSVHGVDPDLFAPAAHPRIPDDRFVIGYVGRLVLVKGLGVLLAALSGMPGGSVLRLVGSGPDEEELRRRAVAYGLADRVEFVPGVAASAVPEVMRGFDVLALPSLSQPHWREQFGRVLIEAMACGIPVVGSQSGEIPRVIGDAGLIVPEGDAPALRAALRQLMGDPTLRAALAARGRERVLAEFTQERVARRVTDVWAEVMGQTGKTGS